MKGWSQSWAKKYREGEKNLMGSRFQIEFKRSNGNLHIQPKGDLDGSSAWQLIRFIHDQYDGHGLIFIDTHHVRSVCPFGSKTFKCNLILHALPADRLFFKGERGVEIAPQGSRVIAARKKHRCRCLRRCEGCACSDKEAGAADASKGKSLSEHGKRSAHMDQSRTGRAVDSGGTLL